MDRAEDIIEEATALKGERSQLNQLWEEIAEVLAPQRVGFTSSTQTNTRNTDRVFDTQPITAKRSLVNAIGGMLRPKSSAAGRWFDVVPEDENLLDDSAVKEWLEFVEERLWNGLYNPKAQFVQATGESDDDVVTFGTATIFTGIHSSQTSLKFKAFHMKDVYIVVDGDNNPNGCVIAESLTARQAAQRWGEEQLHPKMREKLSSDKPEERNKLWPFYWCVKERFDYDPRIPNNKNMPFASYVVDKEHVHLVLEEGFPEYPFAHPRWDTRSGEVYGRGPGVLALPDVLTLNQMGKTMLRALHRAVDPSWLLPSDSMVTPPNLYPGGVGYYDAKAIRNLGLTQPFQQMTSEAKVPWGLNAQAQLREQLMSVFFRNVLNLPVNGPQMTATEVIQRREEFTREVGAIFGRLESDYTAPLVERAFNIMMRQGAFGAIEDIPEALQGGNVEFRFASPVEKAQRQIEELSVVQGVEKIMAIGQVKPEAMRAYDWQEIGKFIGEANDFPSELMLSSAELEERAQQEAAAAAQEQQFQQAERAASAAGSLPPEMIQAAMQQQGQGGGAPGL